jgi:excinuclease ABC subunit A
VTVSFSLGALVGIAGKSGSGKSSLISDTLLPLLRSNSRKQWKNIEENKIDNVVDIQDGSVKGIKIGDRLEGLKHISGYAEISQVPIGRNMNSNPASYIGIWDKIRTLFANQLEVIEQKFTAGHFSFNSKGACTKCGGSGLEKIWLGNDLSIDKICGECNGKRFNNEALSIKYNGKGWVKDPDGNSTGGWFFWTYAFALYKTKVKD